MINLLKMLTLVLILCIFLDLAKAFDTVDYSKLRNKMETQFSFCGILLHLIRNYSSNRIQTHKNKQF